MTTTKVFHLKTNDGDCWYYNDIENARRDKYIFGGIIRPLIVQAGKYDIINGELKERGVEQ